MLISHRRRSLVSASLGIIAASLCLQAACADPKPVSDPVAEPVQEALGPAQGGAGQAQQDDEASKPLRLDREQVTRLEQRNLESLRASELVASWAQPGAERAVMSMFPISNQTDQKIATALDALIARLETALVNDFPVDMMGMDVKMELLREIRAQQAETYDTQRLVQYGAQVGAQYIFSGKAIDAAEVGQPAQYQLVMQVVAVDGGEVVFEHTSALSAEGVE